MTLLSNEHGELYRPEDLEPPKRMKLRYGARLREVKPKPQGRTCKFCGNKMPEHARGNKMYCSDRCRWNARKLRGK